MKKCTNNQHRNRPIDTENRLRAAGRWGGEVEGLGEKGKGTEQRKNKNS